MERKLIESNQHVFGPCSSRTSDPDSIDLRSCLLTLLMLTAHVRASRPAAVAEERREGSFKFVERPGSYLSTHCAAFGCDRDPRPCGAFPLRRLHCSFAADPVRAAFHSIDRPRCARFDFGRFDTVLARDARS